MEIRINKTTYKVTEIDSFSENNFDYTTYALINKNTKKTLVHNTTLDSFTLWGRRAGSHTMTMPEKIEITNS